MATKYERQGEKVNRYINKQKSKLKPTPSKKNSGGPKFVGA